MKDTISFITSLVNVLSCDINSNTCPRKQNKPDARINVSSFPSPSGDIERRDATINGIAIQLFSIDDLFNNDYVKECYHYHQERIINPFNGILDLKNKIWKAINNPYQRFLEDPTRMLRALYQCSKHDLELEEETKDSLIKHSNLLKIIDDSSLVRLTNEFLRMINTRYFYKWMDFIFEETDILNYLGLYFNKENVEDVKKSFNYLSENLDLSENLTLIIKLATILYYSFLDNQKKIDKWTRKFMLSACPKFPKNGTNVPLFCLKSFEGIKNIDNLNNLKEDYLLIKIKMRYLISTLGPTDSMDDVKKAIILFEVLTMRKQEKLLELYEENKNIPINESKINLNGKKIKEIFHVEDKKIGEIKRYLFKNILEDKIENKEEQLIEFMNDYYVKNMNNELL